MFSLTWPASMKIFWNKRKRLHKKGVQLPQDWFGTPTWLLVHCFGTPIWPPWRHVKTLHWIQALNMLAYENIRFSSLFAAGDISRGGTSVTQRQKFHTDDVKYVRNPVRRADWSTEYLHCFSHCLQMTDKRPKATKVKCKHKESLTKQSMLVEYSLL